MRFNLGRYHVAHVNKHRKGKRRLTSSNKKILKQQPTSFQNYAEVLERLGYPVTVKFRSIFPPEGGDLSQLPETFQQGIVSKDEAPWTQHTERHFVSLEVCAFIPIDKRHVEHNA